jgi:chromate transporter
MHRETVPEVRSIGLKALFLGFSKIGLSGFGGVLPFARHFLVEERGWLSAEEFNTLLGLCQFLPGPNVINLSVVVGARYRGVAGSVACVAGLLAGPMVIALLLALLYDQFGSLPVVQGILRGIAAVGCGLLFATAIRMGMAVKHKPFLLPFTVLVFVAIAVLRWPLPAVMIGLLVFTAGIAWWRLQDAAPR